MKKNKAKLMSCCILSLMGCLFLSSGLSASAMENEDSGKASTSSSKNEQKCAENNPEKTYSIEDIYKEALNFGKGDEWANKIRNILEKIQPWNFSYLRAKAYSFCIADGLDHNIALMLSYEVENSVDKLKYDGYDASRYADYIVKMYTYSYGTDPIEKIREKAAEYVECYNFMFAFALKQPDVDPYLADEYASHMAHVHANRDLREVGCVPLVYKRKLDLELSNNSTGGFATALKCADHAAKVYKYIFYTVLNDTRDNHNTVKAHSVAVDTLFN